MSDTMRLKARYAALVKKQQAALGELSELLRDPASSSTAINEIQATVARLNAQQQRIIQELKFSGLEKPERYGSQQARLRSPEIRGVVVGNIQELCVASSLRNILESACVLSGNVIIQRMLRKHR